MITTLRRTQENIKNLLVDIVAIVITAFAIPIQRFFFDIILSILREAIKSVLLSAKSDQPYKQELGMKMAHQVERRNIYSRGVLSYLFE